MTRTVLNSRRSRTSCSIFALATVLAVGASPAAAQSFNGSVSSSTGVGTITTTPGITNIPITSSQAVINWTPTTAPDVNNIITFQNAGTTANFTGSSDFAVLNKINTTDPASIIAMNGTVTSRVSGVQRGSVYFYTPGGFIFGGTSVFSVGSLVVTTLPIVETGSTFISNVGTDNTVVFGQATVPGSSITMGGTVSALSSGFGISPPSNAYVALVAPRVVHTGTITVNGSAALVAAEAATINFSPDGLFDIQVTVGSTDSQGLNVSGDIVGPTPSGATDKQGVYLVAVPKNQAMTMAISSGADLGFTLANTAVDDNGVIVLSAGNNVVNGAVGSKSTAPGTGTAGMAISGAHFTNNVVAEATGLANVSSSAGQSTTFGNSLTIHAGSAQVASSGAGAVVSVADNLSVSTNVAGGVGQSVTAGGITLSASGTGTTTVGGTVTLSANATGGDVSTGTAGSATGGQIAITAANSSTLNLGTVTTSATGTGGNAIASGVNGGAGSGGSIIVTADTGGTINFSSPLTLDVQGFGGGGGGLGSGGAGTGGTARIDLGNNGHLNFTGDVTLNADGLGGGSGSGTGGLGHGGTAAIQSVVGSTTGGVATFNGEVVLSAEGEGGASNTGTGGAGTGGTAQLSASAHQFTLNNGIWLRARGRGGSSGTGTGGSGLGGTAQIVGTGSSHFDVPGTVTVAATGFGGDGGLGGTGTGGNANIKSQNDISLPGDVFVYANGWGGIGFGGNGGLGDAGTIHIEASNGGDLATGNLLTQANGGGGESDQIGATSGNGFGGDIFIQSFANSSLTVNGGLNVDAVGEGGPTSGQVNAGDGTGGTITIQSSGDNASLNIVGNATLSADGNGGFAIGDCSSCGGIGGDGFGGTIHIGADGADADLDLVGASISFDGFLNAHADGVGSIGIDADGGFGKGGEVKLSAGNGAVLSVDGTATLSADGYGGWRNDGGNGGDLAVAGDGQGGFVEVFTWGTGTPDLNLGALDMHADGYGGSSNVQSLTVLGGDGLGGTAWLDAQKGTIDIAGNASVTASGEGGFAQFGTGGDGTGKNAEIDGIGGAVSIGGTATVEVSGRGGDGMIGGDGTGGGQIFDDGSFIDGSFIFAQNGSVSIGGTATISSIGTGGDGFDGGFGQDGGDGGNGSGGFTAIIAANSDLGPSNIILSTLNISASAAGGSGGSGGGASQGGNGGNGGNATAGQANVLAYAGNGHLSVTTVNGTAIATGGAGGDGGNGDNLGGGSGGDGGNAEGGFVEVGTASGGAQAGLSNLGTATYGTITANSSATGGDGGAGKFGTPDGSGGDGGTGDGGQSVLLVRGSQVTVSGTTTLISNGTGGDGGVGGGQLGAQGVGGDGFAGELAVEATSRYQHPEQTGTLTTGAIIGTAAGVGGQGSVDGAGIVEGGSSFVIDRSAAHIASLNFLLSGEEVAPGADESRISITNVPPGIGQTVGTVLVDGTFAFSTPGELSYFINNANLAAQTISLTAGNFVYDPASALPHFGQTFANQVNVTTDNDFVASSVWNVGQTFVVDAPGLIALDLINEDNGVDFSAGGSITIAAINADGFIDLRAGGDIDTGDLTAGSYIYENSTGGKVEVGNIIAGGSVDLIAGTFVHGEDITADGQIFIQANGGNVDLGDGNVTSNLGGIQIDASNNILLGGDLTADGAILLDAGGLIDMANATGGFFRAQAGGTVDAIDLTSDSNIQIFAGGNVTLGNLSAGTTADESSNKAIRIDTDGSLLVGNIVAAGGIDITAGGSVTGQDVTTGDVLITEADGAISYQDISAGLINPQTPTEPFAVALDSAVSISVGNVTASRGIAFITSGTLTTLDLTTDADVVGLVHGAISTGDINAGGRVLLADSSMFTNAGGTIGDAGDDDVDPEVIFAATPVKTGSSITVGDVNAGSFTAAAGTNLTMGTLNTDNGISLDAGAAITTGNLDVGDFVLANGGSITTGTIDAFSVNMTSTAGNISTGDISASGAVTLDAFGDILAGDITAGSIDLMAGDDITTGDLTTQQLLLLSLGDGIQTMSFAGASISLDAGGDISTGDISSIDGVWANAGGNLTTGAIDAVDFIELYAGGNMLTADMDAGQHILLATPGTITTGDIIAGGMFMALGHGNMIFGDATAAEVFLADYAMLTTGGVTTNCVGNCGTLGANGIVIAPPSGSSYSYVTTDGGADGAGQLPGIGGTNGSTYTTSEFTAQAGDDLNFWFNYVTSDGSGYADYAWAALYTSNNVPVATLFTARTQPSGTIVPGQGLPGVEATLNPASVPIIDGAPTWSPLGTDSGSCYAAGCGYTGWISSSYEIANAGNYVLQFGVTNWSDTSFQSGLAFSGITIGGTSVNPALVPTGGSISIGNVNTGKMSASAGTTLTALNIDSTGSVDISSGGNMQTGDISAGTNLRAHSGGAMSLGAISGDLIDLSSVGNMGFTSADAEIEIDMDSDAGITGGAVNAGKIVASAGQTATINGIWNAVGDVELTSNNIDITGTGGINAGGVVNLISSNALQMLIGDGFTGSGYSLTNAEFGRVKGEQIRLVGRGDASANLDMLVGDLTVSGSQLGGVESNGVLVFAVGDVDTLTPSGVIRVVGDVNATGFGSGDSIEFYATRFELDAATGSIGIVSSGSTLAGEIGLYADRIHVAAGTILDKLAANPTYTNYQQDLNQAATGTTQHPEGVLRADSLWIESDNLQDVLIQNTGTGGPGGTPAGFLVHQAYINEDFDSVGPAGSVNLIVNGQVVTQGGTLTGVAARDALVPEGTDITPFTSNSTINGCPLTGQCIIKPPAPPPTANVVDNQIDLITNNPLGDSEFGNEPDIDDNQEGDQGANNPINPPQPLFDTRPLIPSGDVNDPVSGTGNPALLGSDAECQEDEQGQCPAPVKGDGQ